MNQNDLIQLVLFLVAILVCVKPLGGYMAKIYQGRETTLVKYFGRFENVIYRTCGIDPSREMNWKQYAAAMLFFNCICILSAYLLQRMQAYLPLNWQNFSNVAPQLAYNTATSIVTNTGWQAYAGENSLSSFTQCLALLVNNFLSAATGMSILVAFTRAIAQSEVVNLGNYWQDMVRSVLYILLPISLVLAVFLSSQGVMQNFKPYQTFVPIDNSAVNQEQNIIPMGPIASYVAIKQLSSAGAGYFNVNSAHPFENPNQITNFVEMLAIILIPAALCYTFGVMVNARKHAWSLLIVMTLCLAIASIYVIDLERTGNPIFKELGVDKNENMEGKELRLNIFNSSVWAVAATATGSGTINCMHDSLMPLSGAVALILMHIGEIIFGSVGSGMYGMIMLVMITVFVAGLMVGRSPEYLGKRIEPFEMKMTTFVVLILPLVSILLTSWACVNPIANQAIYNPGAHGFSEILYAFTSMRNTNGSAFAGLAADNYFYNIYGALAMLSGRYWQAIAALAIAGTLAAKKIAPVSHSSLVKNNFWFMLMLIFIILTLGVLSFLPTLALGPIAEHITLKGMYNV